MKLLMLILFFPFSFEGENGRELLDTALEKCSRLESLEACRDILYSSCRIQRMASSRCVVIRTRGKD